MISIVKSRRVWYSLSGIMVAASLIGFVVWGLRLGIDFTGGSLLEISFSGTPPTIQEITTAVSPEPLEVVTVQTVGDTGAILRFGNVDEDTHKKILEQLSQKFGTPDAPVIENRFETIGPSLGQELRRRTIWAIAIVVLAIMAYIAWAFRKVSKPIASWKYGFVAAIALFHDVIISVGAFVLLGKFYGIEVNTAFIAALLTILGYSINDTIVVFDRIRENLLRHSSDSFEKTVDRSVQETLTRSINTSFTALLALFSILAFGGATIRDFVFALIVGIVIGTYSSIFLASPLLVTWERFRLRSGK
jgi:preprotein translocase subunit SecF